MKLKEGKKLDKHLVLPFVIKAFDDESGTFEGFAATFEDPMGPGDSYGDVIKPGAFAKTIAEHQAAGRPVKMLWNHNMGGTNKVPIGKYLASEIAEVERDGKKGLYVKGRFTPGIKLAEEVHAAMKDGTITELSIGYYIRKWESPPFGSKADLILTELELTEISPVVYAANDNATISGVKAAPDLASMSPEDLASLRAALAALDSEAAQAPPAEPTPDTPQAETPAPVEPPPDPTTANEADALAKHPQATLLAAHAVSAYVKARLG